MSKRVVIGPRMRDVVRLAGLRPEGMSRFDIAVKVGPHGSTCYGYATVRRALRAGLVDLVPAPEGSGRRGMYVVLPD